MLATLSPQLRSSPWPRFPISKRVASFTPPLGMQQSTAPLMAYLSHPHRDQSPDDPSYAFGYMMMPTDGGRMEDPAAQEREFQDEIKSLNTLFAADPYAGMDAINPFANPPSQLPRNHQFTFNPPVVHGVDAVYYSQAQHMSSMSAPYMGMHNPAFEFIGFDPANPYTPTEGVADSFADLNMAATALASTVPPGSGILQSLETAMDANTPSSPHSNLQSPSSVPSNYEGVSPKHVEPTPDNFFLPYPEPTRRVQKPQQASSQLLRFPHFGSDPAFSERFTRPTESPTFADVSDRLERKTRFALRPSHSEDSTPVSTPHPGRPYAQRSPDRGASADSERSVYNDDGVTTKRRRIDSSSQDASTSGDERRSVSQSRNPRNSQSPSRNRRKSSGTGSAAARRNLTEEQRRQNHNKSEQRRRTVITDDLGLVRHLIPALNNTTASKAIAIRETYQFLYELVESNKELEQSLGPEIARAGPYPSAEFSRPAPPPPPAGL